MLKEPTVLFVRVVPDEYVDADVLIYLRYIQNYLFLGDLLFFLEDFGSPKQSKITSVRVDPLDCTVLENVRAPTDSDTAFDHSNDIIVYFYT